MFRYRAGFLSGHIVQAVSALGFFIFISGIATTEALALNESDVLVLYNVDSPEGTEIADYYRQVHPNVQLLGLVGVSTSEEISQDHYLDVIRPQVLDGLSFGTEVIVTTKGLPLRIVNDQPNPGTYPGWRGSSFGVSLFGDWWEPYSSLESELTRVDLIDSASMMGDQAAFMSPPSFPFSTDHQASNPYFNTPLAFERKDPGTEGMRLTSRLDGFSVSDVKDSIDRAQMAYLLPDEHMIVLDDDPNAPAADVDRMPQLAFDVLDRAGQTFVYDNTNAAITDSPNPVIGYVSHGKHGSGKGYIDDLDFEIANGAVFHTWESFNAYSFEQGGNHYGQGLVAEWIEAGGTAGLGHVAEPGASAATVANEDIFWQMMLDGFTFAEAAWAATPQLSYVNTVVGDPLMKMKAWVPGDVDLDGMVNLQDLSVVLSNWNVWSTGGILAGDINLDGFIGVNDLLLVLNNFSSNTPQGTVTSPEPGSVSLLICGLFYMTAGRTRRA